MIMRSFGPFGGVVSSVDPSVIPDHCAQAMLNMMVENGRLGWRRSYRELAAHDATITATYGLGYLLGLETDGDEVEEFVTVVTKSGNTRPYAIHPTTGAKTEIKNGVASVTLHASTWRMVTFREKSYWVNTNDTNPVWKHTIGDAASFAPVTNSITTPTLDLVAQLQYSTSGSTTANTYDTAGWSGVTLPGGITNASANVSAATSALSGESLKVAMQSGASTAFDVTFAAAKDLSYNDLHIFSFRLETVGNAGTPQNEIDPLDSILVDFYNGTTYVGAVLQRHKRFENGAWSYWALLSLADIPRANRTACTRARVRARVLDKTGWDPLMYLTVHPFTIGMVDCSGSTAAATKSKFAYSYINTVQNDETGLFGVTSPTDPWVQFSNDELRGLAPLSLKPTWKLGCWVKFTITASSDASIDKNRLYVDDRAVWRRFDEIADGGVSPTTATSYFRLTKKEREALPARSETQPGPFPNMVFAFVHKSRMIWLKKGSDLNVIHSGQGLPERLPSNADLLDDASRPGQYTLGQNYAEKPVCGFSVGDVVAVFGGSGLHTQIGETGATMTSFKRVGGSKPILNPEAGCVWRDSGGNPALVWVSRDGINMLSTNQDFAGEDSPTVEEVSGDIRDKVGADNLVPVASKVRLWVDEMQDMLVISWEDQAYALRRPSLVDGVRRWEPYEYRLFGTDSELKYWQTPNRYGPRAISDVGHFLEFEFNSATNEYMDTAGELLIEGDGFSMPEMYWQSKDWDGPNRRVLRAEVTPRVDVGVHGGAPQIEVLGTELDSLTTLQTFPGGLSQKTLTWGPSVQGRSLSYKLSFGDADNFNINHYIWDRIEITESNPLSPRRTQ